MSLTVTVPSTNPSPTGLPAAELTGVTKRYRNGVTAVDNLSLTLRQGEIVALLGPNGAGKSTAVKLLMGLAAPTHGTVRIFGQDPRFATSRLRTGVMLQVGKAPETLRVREHLDLFRGYYPAPLSALELIRIAGLEGLENRLFGQLSGGQKQRVLFALALAGDPDLVFLDEPTVGLDIEARRAMWKEIRALAAQGKTVLLTTHYLEEADALAHRIIVLNKGQLISEGTPAQIKAQASGIPALHPNDARATNAAAASSAKLIRCLTTLSPAHLRLMPGVTTVDQPPRELDSLAPLPTAILSTQPEATLREILALDPHLANLEVTPPALEDAFLALTAN
jgi:ABC-2 type transport system ATP-binding protein